MPSVLISCRCFVISKHTNSVQKPESNCGNGSENCPMLAPVKRRALGNDWHEQSPYGSLVRPGADGSTSLRINSRVWSGDSVSLPGPPRRTVVSETQPRRHDGSRADQEWHKLPGCFSLPAKVINSCPDSWDLDGFVENCLFQRDRKCWSFTHFPH